MKIVLRHSKKIMWIALVAVVVIAMGTQLIKVLPSAHAAGISGWETVLWPNDNTHPNVVSDCNRDGGNVKPDMCLYHVTSQSVQLGAYRQVSSVFSECGQSATGSPAVDWSATESTSYSWGSGFTVSINVGVPLSEGIALGVTTSVSVMNTWTVTQSATNGGAYMFQIPAGHKGWVIWAPYMHVIHGWLEVHYPSQVFGHYYWYYPGQGSGALQITTPVQLPSGVADGRYSAVVVPC